tara:strand:+ start:294 stop:635 length:342 start_codon:yes stop_codon:yes gene_type:complete
MKLWNRAICITSRKSIMVIVVILLSTFVLASVFPGETKVEKHIQLERKEQTWIPTAEDIAYQDSMYQIIQNTQNDIDTIKNNIMYILERLEYADGSYDSIRYVKGGKIDKRRN